MYRIFPMCSRTVIYLNHHGQPMADESRRIRVRRQKPNLLRLMVKRLAGQKARPRNYPNVPNGLIHLLNKGGEAYGVSGQRAFQVYSRAVRKIKDYWDR